MTQEQFLHNYSEVLLNVTFIVSMLFPFVIASWWKWWESQWGKNMVLLELSIAVTILPSILFVDWHIDAAALHWMQAAGFTLVPIVVIHRTYLIIRTQREGAVKVRKKREDPDATVSESK